MSESHHEVILWGVSISPYVRKVMVALAEKNIQYTHHEILPKVILQATEQAVPEAFDLSSPLGKIPAIQVGNHQISDSSIIADYLDRKFLTGHKLYPENPEDHAKARWFEHYSDTVLTDTCYKKIFFEGVVKPKALNQAPDIECIERAVNEELPPLFDYLDKSLEKKQWFCEACFSMADVAVATQILALKMYGLNVHEQHKNLKEHFNRVIDRKSFEKLLA